MGQTPRSELVGMEVVDIRGDKVGKIDSLLLHGDGDEPNWALVKLGLLGMRDALIPLQDAEPKGAVSSGSPTRRTTSARRRASSRRAMGSPTIRPTSCTATTASSP